MTASSTKPARAPSEEALKAASKLSANHGGHGPFVQMRVETLALALDGFAADHLSTALLNLSRAEKVIAAVRAHGDDATGSLELAQAMWEALDEYDRATAMKITGRE